MKPCQIIEHATAHTISIENGKKTHTKQQSHFSHLLMPSMAFVRMRFVLFDSCRFPLIMHIFSRQICLRLYTRFQLFDILTINSTDLEMFETHEQHTTLFDDFVLADHYYD